MIGIGHRTALAALAALALAGCGPDETATTVVFVHRETISVRGAVEMVENEDGERIPYLWAPGTIVVFRADRTLGGHTGLYGTAYRIVEGGDLEEIGPVDTDRTDDALAREFGVEPPPEP